MKTGGDGAVGGQEKGEEQKEGGGDSGARKYRRTLFKFLQLWSIDPAPPVP